MLRHTENPNVLMFLEPELRKSTQMIEIHQILSGFANTISSVAQACLANDFWRFSNVPKTQLGIVKILIVLMTSGPEFAKLRLE